MLSMLESPRVVTRPALHEDTLPLMCERCGVHEVASPGEICQPCRIEESDWNWQGWSEAIYEGTGR